MKRDSLVSDLAGMSTFDVNAQRRRLTQWAARNAILQGFTADDMAFYYKAVVSELCKRKKAAGQDCAPGDYSPLSWSGSNTGSDEEPDETKHTAGAVAAARSAFQAAKKAGKGKKKGKSEGVDELENSDNRIIEIIETKKGAVFNVTNLKSLRSIRETIDAMIRQMEGKEESINLSEEPTKSGDGASETKNSPSFEQIKSYFKRVKESN